MGPPSLLWPLCAPPCLGLGTSNQSFQLIPEETVGPVSDVPVHVDVQLLDSRAVGNRVDEVQGRVFRIQFSFRNPPLESSEKVLGVALHDKLAVAWETPFPRANRIDEQVGKGCLDPGVKVNFRLFENHNRATGDIEALNNHRKHLADTKSDIGQLD